MLTSVHIDGEDGFKKLVHVVGKLAKLPGRLEASTPTAARRSPTVHSPKAFPHN